MTDEKKIELLKEKFQQVIQGAMAKDGSADTIFLSFFNAIKDNEAFFKDLAADDKSKKEQENVKLAEKISENDTKIAEADTIISGK